MPPGLAGLRTIELKNGPEGQGALTPQYPSTAVLEQWARKFTGQGALFHAFGYEVPNIK